MNYKPRFAQGKLNKLSAHFKCVLVTGARQVGKTTLLRHTFPDYRLIEFDAVQDLYGAKKDPELFLDSFKPPLILDEIQHVPELLPALKRKLDSSGKKGQYLLSGSQNLSMMKGITESLAGRVGGCVKFFL